jgi:gas vesicle protein
MFRRLNSRKGQNTAEYAILIGVIVAAAIAMQIYVRRGMQARVKDAVDFTQTADDDAGNGLFKQSQYEPYYMATNFSTSQSGQTSEQLQQGGGIVKDSISETTTRTGNQTYSNYMVANQ